MSLSNSRILSLIPLELLEEVIQQYNQPGRYYHREKHIEECFSHLKEVEDKLTSPTEVALALLFHDIVYIPQASDNEEKSAGQAQTYLTNIYPQEIIAKVKSLIMATAHPAPIQTTDEAFIVDIDCAILGAEAHRYREYQREVRREYEHLSDVAFIEGRTAFLEQILAQKKVYHTKEFRIRYEEQARHNIELELKRYYSDFK